MTANPAMQTNSTDKEKQRRKISEGNGFIAALDQSGGSTPKALKQYGIDESAYTDETGMFDKVHEMRTRIITSPAFNGEKILGAILFEKTMDNAIESIPTAQYLWKKLDVVPFLKIDKGLANEADGVQLMKPMPELESLLERANDAGIFGTKMRSVIQSASPTGVATNVAQQFDVGNIILSYDLVPIIEPEVNIHAPDKAACEELLKEEILKNLEYVPAGKQVMLKLTLPETPNLYDDLIKHDKVLSVVALSGGYDIEEACRRLAENNGMVASFSRALSNDLQASQSDEEFNKALETAINKIYTASIS